MNATELSDHIGRRIVGFILVNVVSNLDSCELPPELGLDESAVGVIVGTISHRTLQGNILGNILG